VLPLFNLQLILFRVWFQKDITQCRSIQWRQKLFVRSTQDVDIWMEIPFQHDVYIWRNYSVSSYLSFIPIFWNVLIWLKYDSMYILIHHLLCCFDNCFTCFENRNDPDLVQAFLKKWWVESDFKAPNLPLSLRLQVSGCHYNSIYNNTWTKQVKQLSKQHQTQWSKCQRHFYVTHW
jgi:hypothetical protein